MQFISPRAYQTEVVAIKHLTPNFIRVTFADPELAHFGTDGLDQRIKLFLPRPDGSYPDIGLFDEPRPNIMAWYRRWRDLPPAEQNPIRTYTVRAARPEQAEIDIDFVYHGDSGPASAWVASATINSPMIIIGPDKRAETAGGGIEWKPGTARQLLLVGDETAVPAIGSILESLPAHVEGHAFLEVPTSADTIELSTPAHIAINWICRDGADHGDKLVAAVRHWGASFGAQTYPGSATAVPEIEAALDTDPEGILWDVPPEEDRDRYAWIAGESKAVTGLRRYLVNDLGWDKKSIAFMGYWRMGRAEGS